MNQGMILGEMEITGYQDTTALGQLAADVTNTADRTKSDPASDRSPAESVQR